MNELKMELPACLGRALTWILTLTLLMCTWTGYAGEAADVAPPTDDPKHVTDAPPSGHDPKAVADPKELLSAKSFWEQDKLTGNWWGFRDTLAEHGVMLESSVTQFYQGATSGGNEQMGRYGGKWDVYLILDSERMGLWKGGNLLVHGVDWQFGQNANLDAVGLAPVNGNLTTPLPTKPAFALTNLLFSQKLPYDFSFLVGRTNLMDVWSLLYPNYGRGVDGFMNLSLLLPLNAVPSVPIISNTAGFLHGGAKGINAGFLVMESQNSPTTVGLDFPNGVTLVGLARYNSNFFDLPGTQTLLGSYATGSYTSFDDAGWVITPTGGVIPGKQSGTWMVTYIGEQRYWMHPHNEKRYAQVTGRVGYSSEDTSPFGVTAALSTEAVGVWDARPADRMGVGYFFNGLSGDYKSLLAPVDPLQNIHGGEIYYNVELTPWFHVTGDLQVILPATRANETAVVLGVRAKVDL